MSKFFLASGALAFGIAAACACVVVQADGTPNAPLAKLAASKAAESDGPADATGEDISAAYAASCIWPAGFPERPVLKAELLALKEKGESVASGDGSAAWIPLVIAAGLSLVLAVAACLKIIADFKRLLGRNEAAGSALTGDRRHELPAAVGLAIAGGVAGGFCVLAVISGLGLSSPIIRAGELHALVGVFLLPMAAWIGSCTVLWRTEETWPSFWLVPAVGLLAAVLMVVWGLLSGALSPRWYVAAVVFWSGLAYATAQALLEKADSIVASWPLTGSVTSSAAGTEVADEISLT